MIQSSQQTAERIATSMRSASESIRSASSRTVTFASQTTVTVNNEAQSMHREMISLTNMFNELFQQTVEDLQSVEQEFRATDVEIGLNFNPLIHHTIK